MPRLPTAEELGPVQIHDTRDPTPDFSATKQAAARITHTASQSGQGAEALGRGIAQLGHGISAGLQGIGESDDRLNGALASSSFQSSLLNLHDEAKHTTDPEKLQEYPGKINAALQAATVNLNDQQRRLFVAQHSDDATRAGLAIKEYGYQLQKDRSLADTFTNLSQLRDSNLKTDDPEKHAQAIETMGQTYDGLVQKGYISAEYAAQAKDTWTKSFSKAYLEDKPPDERLRILKAALGYPPDGAPAQAPGVAPASGAAVASLHGVIPGQGDPHKPGFDPNATQFHDYSQGRGGATTPQGQGTAPLGQSARPGDVPAYNTFSIYQHAIKAIESSGGNYSAIGPRTKSGDRAYGAYQVMGENIPSWTKAALGYSMTSQEFLRDKSAQDLVFNHQFGQYIQKYGTPQDAASAWFTGRPIGVGSSAARDVLGTSGNQYVALFNKHIGDKGIDSASSHIDTRLPSLMPRDQLITMMRQTESEVGRLTHQQTVAAEQEKVEVNHLRLDDTNSIKTTGIENPALSPERIGASFGLEEAARFSQHRENAHDYYNQMNGIEQVSAEQMQARVDALAPRDGQLGFDDRRKLQDDAQKHVKELLKVRLEDPAAAADKLPAVQRAAKGASLDRPWSYTPLISARMAAQEQLGIPVDFRNPLSKAEATQLLGIVQQALPQNRMKAVRELVETVNGAVGAGAGDSQTDALAAKALGFVLRTYHGNEDVRTKAAAVLKKLSIGDPDLGGVARQLDEATTNSAADAATGKIQGAFPLPHDEDMAMLRSDPTKYSQWFDDVFGPGTAATALGVGR